MYPADFLAKWGPKVYESRGDLASDLGSVVHDRYSKLKDALQYALWLLGESHPPEGCRTERFIVEAKELLRTGEYTRCPVCLQPFNPKSPCDCC